MDIPHDIALHDNDDDDIDNFAPDGYRARDWNSMNSSDVANAVADFELFEVFSLLLLEMYDTLNLYILHGLPNEFLYQYLESIQILDNYVHLLLLDFMDLVFYPLSNLAPDDESAITLDEDLRSQDEKSVL